ncbi:hypothetical protein FOZ61_001230 [Perkinsus olseni]|uniref:Peptidase A1 domain-containing protein n=1 Tax=Perkinsus olseni TaxID=32597 RepID=A0A7J6KS94_PEROL|nr:hypothetical protein FOZ61_001230 [Perkinsus olseni]KAF4650175.1 hypothetical protein FOL46_001160 [Perkinsus olseni]
MDMVFSANSEVDYQNLTVAVDTESCLPYGVSRFTYRDDYSVLLFPNTVRQIVSPRHEINGLLQIGLDVGYEAPEGLRPSHTIGLGGGGDRQRYPSLMSQLELVLGPSSFALYLNKPVCDHIDGELIIGGGDSNLYTPPLTFVPLSLQDVPVVPVAHLKIGNSFERPIDGFAIIDTGAQDMLVPEPHRDVLRERILTEIAIRSGTEAGSNYIPTLDLTIFDCFFMRFLPPIEIGLGKLGEAPTTLTNYARKVDGTCFLAIKGAADNRWTLPAFIIPGNYFEFQPSEGRLGVAKLRDW